jgi:hypothetical protein
METVDKLKNNKCGQYMKELVSDGFGIWI